MQPTVKERGRTLHFSEGRAPTEMTWNSAGQVVSPLHLFTYSVTDLEPYGLMNSYFTLGIISQYYFVYFVSIVPALATGGSFRGSRVPLT